MKKDETIRRALHHIKACACMDELRAYWSGMNERQPLVARSAEVIKAKDVRKSELSGVKP